MSVVRIGSLFGRRGNRRQITGGNSPTDQPAPVLEAPRESTPPDTVRSPPPPYASNYSPTPSSTRVSEQPTTMATTSSELCVACHNAPQKPGNQFCSVECFRDYQQNRNEDLWVKVITQVQTEQQSSGPTNPYSSPPSPPPSAPASPYHGATPGSSFNTTTNQSNDPNALAPPPRATATHGSQSSYPSPGTQHPHHIPPPRTHDPTIVVNSSPDPAFLSSTATSPRSRATCQMCLKGEPRWKCGKCVDHVVCHKCWSTLAEDPSHPLSPTTVPPPDTGPQPPNPPDALSGSGTRYPLPPNGTPSGRNGPSTRPGVGSNGSTAGTPTSYQPMGSSGSRVAFSPHLPSNPPPRTATPDDDTYFQATPEHNGPRPSHSHPRFNSSQLASFPEHSSEEDDYREQMNSASFGQPRMGNMASPTSAGRPSPSGPNPTSIHRAATVGGPRPLPPPPGPQPTTYPSGDIDPSYTSPSAPTVSPLSASITPSPTTGTTYLQTDYQPLQSKPSMTGGSAPPRQPGLSQYPQSHTSPPQSNTSSYPGPVSPSSTSPYTQYPPSPGTQPSPTGPYTQSPSWQQPSSPPTTWNQPLSNDSPRGPSHPHSANRGGNRYSAPPGSFNAPSHQYERPPPQNSTQSSPHQPPTYNAMGQTPPGPPPQANQSSQPSSQRPHGWTSPSGSPYLTTTPRGVGVGPGGQPGQNQNQRGQRASWAPQAGSPPSPPPLQQPAKDAPRIVIPQPPKKAKGQGIMSRLLGRKSTSSIPTAPSAMTPTSPTSPPPPPPKSQSYRPHTGRPPAMHNSFQPPPTHGPPTHHPHGHGRGSGSGPGPGYGYGPAPGHGPPRPRPQGRSTSESGFRPQVPTNNNQNNYVSAPNTYPARPPPHLSHAPPRQSPPSARGYQHQASPINVIPSHTSPTSYAPLNSNPHSNSQTQRQMQPPTRMQTGTQMQTQTQTAGWSEVQAYTNNQLGRSHTLAAPGRSTFTSQNQVSSPGDILRQIKGVSIGTATQSTGGSPAGPGGYRSQKPRDDDSSDEGHPYPNPNPNPNPNLNSGLNTQQDGYSSDGAGPSETRAHPRGADSPYAGSYYGEDDTGSLNEHTGNRERGDETSEDEGPNHGGAANAGGRNIDDREELRLRHHGGEDDNDPATVQAHRHIEMRGIGGDETESDENEGNPAVRGPIHVDLPNLPP